MYLYKLTHWKLLEEQWEKTDIHFNWRQGFLFGKTADLSSKSSLSLSKTWEKKNPKYSKLKRQNLCVFVLVVCILWPKKVMHLCRCMRKSDIYLVYALLQPFIQDRFLRTRQIFSLCSLYDSHGDTGSYRLKLQARILMA